MRRTLLLLLALSCGLVVGCSDDSAEPPTPGIVTFEDFPLIDGLEYTYLTGSGDGPLLDTLQVVLSDNRNPPDVKPGRDFFGFTMFVKPHGSSEPPVEYRGNIWHPGPDTLSVDPRFAPLGQSYYVFPFEVRDTWENNGVNRVVAMETVDLPAGRFDNAYRICFKEWEELDFGCSWTHWFVPGIGIVKVDYDLPDDSPCAPDVNLRVWELLAVPSELNP